MSKYPRKYENLFRNNEDSMNLMEYIDENHDLISPIQHMCGMCPMYPISGYPMQCMPMQNIGLHPMYNIAGMNNMPMNPFEDDDYDHDDYMDFD